MHKSLRKARGKELDEDGRVVEAGGVYKRLVFAPPPESTRPKAARVCAPSNNRHFLELSRHSNHHLDKIGIV